jgi:hypothetical protein
MRTILLHKLQQIQLNSTFLRSFSSVCEKIFADNNFEIYLQKDEKPFVKYMDDGVYQKTDLTNTIYKKLHKEKWRYKDILINNNGMICKLIDLDSEEMCDMLQNIELYR